MKKLLCTILTISIMLSGLAFSEEYSNNYGIWEMRALLDEFNMPTGYFYIGNADPIEGTFSNSATTNSPLLVNLFSVGNTMAFRLAEYGRSVVKNSYSHDRTYEVVMMDTKGERHYFNGIMVSGGSEINFVTNEALEIITALCEEGTVRFAITDTENLTTKYVFSIENTKGFDNCLTDYFYQRLFGIDINAYMPNDSSEIRIDTLQNLISKGRYSSLKDCILNKAEQEGGYKYVSSEDSPILTIIANENNSIQSIIFKHYTDDIDYFKSLNLIKLVENGLNINDRTFVQLLIIEYALDSSILIHDIIGGNQDNPLKNLFASIESEQNYNGWTYRTIIDINEKSLITELKRVK